MPVTTQVPSSPLPEDSPAESLANYLRGYGGANPAALAALAQRRDWKVLAQQELDRRTLQLLTVLDDEVLRALAGGSVDFGMVAEQVLREGRKD